MIELLLEVSKNPQTSSKPSVWFTGWDNCNGCLNIGYRVSGIEKARLLLGLNYGTGEPDCAV
jgi:hypothetical protein